MDENQMWRIVAIAVGVIVIIPLYRKYAKWRDRQWDKLGALLRGLGR